MQILKVMNIFLQMVSRNPFPWKLIEFIPDASTVLPAKDREAPIEGHEEMKRNRDEGTPNGDQKSCLGLSCHTA